MWLLGLQWFKRLMNQACAKCRQYVALGRDRWCVGCAALESCQLELSGEWSGFAGLRRIANDLCQRCLSRRGGWITRAPEGRAAGGAETKEAAAWWEPRQR